MAKNGEFEVLRLENKKHQITNRIDDGLQHDNPQLLILTSIEFIQENSENYYSITL